MFTKIIIANRGEIACRIVRTARRLGVATVAVHTPVDRGALFARVADEAHEIGQGASGYLDAAGIIAVARRTGAQAVHPGYGFLSENAEFAEACARAGLVFIGPSPAAMRAMGLKSTAKTLMAKAGAPIVPGYHGDNQTPKFLRSKAYEIGYPVLIKAVAGGGGRGMRRVDAHVEFEAALESATREAQAGFGDSRVLIEKYVTKPRHIEVQVFGDAHGAVVHLFERDCSLQRRHQKVIEEAPAADLPETTRRAMWAAAVMAAKAVGYVGAGTVEFIVEDEGRGAFHFLEMNTRLQVEHPVTEEICGVDLVEWQLRVAAGEPLPMTQEQITCRGFAVEARLYAEDPEHEFLPSPGRIIAFDPPKGEGIRVETGVEAGDEVSPHYDPMIAKIIACGATRGEAFERLHGALAETFVVGPKTNVGFLKALTAAPEVRRGGVDTAFIDAHSARLGAAPRPPDRIAITAGAFALINRSAPPFVDDGDPWSVSDGFELTGERTVGLDAGVDGRTLRLSVTTSQGRRRLNFPEGEGVWEDEAQKPRVIFADKSTFVVFEGRQTKVALTDPLEGASGGVRASSGDVEAPMHGRVVSIAVREGEEVALGARLAVVEAMKMEHTLTAPHTGTVVDLAAKVGDQVEQGARLMRVAPAGPGPR